MLRGGVTGRLTPARHMWGSLHSMVKLPKHRCSIVNSEVLIPVHCLSGTHNKLTVMVQVFFNSHSYPRPQHWRRGLIIMMRPMQQEESHLSWFEKNKESFLHTWGLRFIPTPHICFIWIPHVPITRKPFNFSLIIMPKVSWCRIPIS